MYLKCVGKESFFPLLSALFSVTASYLTSHLEQLQWGFYEELRCIEQSHLAVKVITSVAEAKPWCYRRDLLISVPSSYPDEKILLKIFGNSSFLSAQSHPDLVPEAKKHAIGHTIIKS